MVKWFGQIVFRSNATLLLALLLVAGLASPQCASQGVTGDSVIMGEYRGDLIKIKTTSRLAGAIDSLTWRRKEFINSYDHGRQLQSAVHFNGLGACLNPTEAGSRPDGVGRRSSSQLISLAVSNNVLETVTRMAYWLAPRSPAHNCPPGAKVMNRTILSDVVLRKKVTIGYGVLRNVIEHDVTYCVENNYDLGVFESLTAYLPPEFSTFWKLDLRMGGLTRLSAGPGEQAAPVIFSTPDHAHALGVYSPGLPQAAWPNHGYGRWRYDYLPGSGVATVKWNSVYRMRKVKPSCYRFACYSIVGDLASVQKSILDLHLLFQTTPPKP